MWIVYNRSDPATCGFEVPTETEAEEFCLENPDYRYVWFGKGKR